MDEDELRRHLAEASHKKQIAAYERVAGQSLRAPGRSSPKAVVGQAPHPQPAESQAATAQFKEFSASELYCPKCGKSMPVRAKRLLILSTGDLVEYVCRKCGESLGRKK